MATNKIFQVKRQILDFLSTLEKPYHQALPTHKALSIMFGVAQETVRKAVIELKEEGVLIGKRGSGIFINEQKSNTKKTKKIALIYMNQADYHHKSPYPKQIIDALRAKLAAKKYQLNIHRFTQEEFAIFFTQLKEINYDGYILLEIFHQYIIREVESLCRPVVSIDTDLSFNGIPSILLENSYGAALLTKLFIDRNHKKIIFANRPSQRMINNILVKDPVSEERYLGYQITMKLNSLTPIRISAPNHISFLQKADHIAQSILELKSRPSIIICDSDALSNDLIDSFQYHGLKIPEDIQIAGFGYDITPERNHIPYPTIAYDWEEMGNLTGETILTQINNIQLEKYQFTISANIKNHDCIKKHSSTAKNKV